MTIKTIYNHNWSDTWIVYKRTKYNKIHFTFGCFNKSDVEAMARDLGFNLVKKNNTNEYLNGQLV